MWGTFRNQNKKSKSDTMTDAPNLSASASFDDFSTYKSNLQIPDDDNFIQSNDELITSLNSQIKELRDKLQNSEAISEDNLKLTTAKSKLESSNKSLQNRLNICINQLDQLKKQLVCVNEEKESLKIKLSQSEKAISDIELTKNRELKVQSDFAQNQKQLLTNLTEKNSRLLFIAANKFNHSFPTIDDFTLYIQNQDFNFSSLDHSNQKDLSTTTTMSNVSENSDDMLNVIKKLKKKVRKYKQVILDFQNENTILNDNLTESRQKAEKDFQDLKTKHKQEILNNRETIQQLQRTITDLKTENDKLNQRLKCEMNSKVNFTPNEITDSSSLQIQSLQSNLSKYEEDLKGSKKNNFKMKKKIQNLIKFIEEDEETQQKLEQENQTLKNNIQTLTNEMMSLRETNSQLTDDNFTLTNENQLLKEEKKSLNETLKKLKTDNNKIQSERDKLKTTCRDFHRIVNKQKNDISILTAEKEKLTKTLTENRNELTETQEKLNKSNEQLTNMEFALRTMDQTLQYDRSIPIASWYHSNLPKELSSDICSIGQKHKDTVQNRLQEVLSLVASYINSKEEKYQSIINELNEKQKHFNESLKKTALLVDDTYFNEFMDFENEKYFDIIESFIKKHQNHSVTMEPVKGTKESDEIAKLIEIVNVNSFEDAIEQIQMMISTIDEANSSFVKIKNKNQNIKKAYNELISHFNEFRENTIHQIEEKSSEIKYLKEELTARENQIVISEKNYEEYVESQIQKVDEADQKTMTFEIVEKRTSEMCAAIAQNFERELKDKTKQNESLQRQNKKFNKKINKIKKNNEHLNEKVISLTKEIESLHQAISSQNEEMNKQKCLVDNNQMKINELTQQLTTKTEENQFLTSKIQKAKTAFSNLKDKYLLLNKEEKSLKIQLETAQTENERIKSEMQSALSVSENHYKVKIGQLNSDNEMRIQDIYQFVADTFSQFYDPKTPLDESGFRNILHEVKRCLNSPSDYHFDDQPQSFIVSKNDSDDYLQRLIVNANEDRPNEFVF